MTDVTGPAETPDENLAPAIPGNDAQTDPTLITTPLPNDVVDTPSTVNGVPVDEQPPAESSVGGNLNPEAVVTPGFVNGSQVSPADATNEVNGEILETQEIDLFIIHDEADDGTRVLEVQRPTTYFELAEAAGVTISAFELANRNGVHNSVYDIPAGAHIVIPTPQLPVPADPPAVDLETALEQAAVTQNAAQALQAQATDLQAGIDPGFAAEAAGVPVVDIPGSTPPSTAAVPDDAPPVDVETIAAQPAATPITDAAPDVITTPDHPTPAAVDPVADVLSTPDHPTIAKVETQAQVGDTPADTTGEPADLSARPAPTDAPVVLDPPVASDEVPPTPVDSPAPVEAAPATPADDGSV